jgi:hypothetical protein
MIKLKCIGTQFPPDEGMSKSPRGPMGRLDESLVALKVGGQVGVDSLRTRQQTAAAHALRAALNRGEKVSDVSHLTDVSKADPSLLPADLLSLRKCLTVEASQAISEPGMNVLKSSIPREYRMENSEIGLLWEEPFPSAKPTSRAEVLQLADAMERMLRDVQAGRRAPRSATGGDLCDAAAGMLALHNSSAVVDSLCVVDIVFCELVRHVTVSCAERGMLLEHVRRALFGYVKDLLRLTKVFADDRSAAERTVVTVDEKMRLLREELAAIQSSEMKAQRDVRRLERMHNLQVAKTARERALHDLHPSSSEGSDEESLADAVRKARAEIEPARRESMAMPIITPSRFPHVRNRPPPTVPLTDASVLTDPITYLSPLLLLGQVAPPPKPNSRGLEGLRNPKKKDAATNTKPFQEPPAPYADRYAPRRPSVAQPSSATTLEMAELRRSFTSSRRSLSIAAVLDPRERTGAATQTEGGDLATNEAQTEMTIASDANLATEIFDEPPSPRSPVGSAARTSGEAAVVTRDGTSVGVQCDPPEPRRRLVSVAQGALIEPQQLGARELRCSVTEEPPTRREEKAVRTTSAKRDAKHRAEGVKLRLGASMGQGQVGMGQPVGGRTSPTRGADDSEAGTPGGIGQSGSPHQAFATASPKPTTGTPMQSSGTPHFGSGTAGSALGSGRFGAAKGEPEATAEPLSPFQKSLSSLIKTHGVGQKGMAMLDLNQILNESAGSIRRNALPKHLTTPLAPTPSGRSKSRSNRWLFGAIYAMHELALRDGVTTELFNLPARYFSMKHGSMMAEGFFSDFLACMAVCISIPRAAAAGQFFNLCGVLNFAKDARFSSDAYRFYLALWDQFRTRRTIAKELQEDADCFIPASMAFSIIESVLRQAYNSEIAGLSAAVAAAMRSPVLCDSLELQFPPTPLPTETVLTDSSEMWNLDTLLQLLAANFASVIRPTIGSLGTQVRSGLDSSALLVAGSSIL